MFRKPPGPSFRPFRQERRQSGQDGDQSAHEQHRSGIPLEKGNPAQQTEKEDMGKIQRHGMAGQEG